MRQFGTGSDVQRAAQAVTAALQGLAGGDMAQALAGAAAPYVAQVIRSQTQGSQEANLMAHAVLGAVVAQINGNSALAGAATGELIATQLYPNVKPEDMSEEQRQTVSLLSTLAAGLAGGVTGDSTADAFAGAQAGKNAVENNSVAVLKNIFSVGGKVCVSNAVCRAEVAKVSVDVLIATGVSAEVALQVSQNLKPEDIDALASMATGDLNALTMYLTRKAVTYMVADATGKGNSSESQPNMGANLSDAEKAELGGTGSGSPGGWGPQDEMNGSKQQGDKPVQKLNQQQESSIRKIDNLVNNSLKDHDIAGALKDMSGNPVLRPDGSGRYWNHMKEMQDTLNGLRRHADILRGVNNPEAQAAYGRAVDAINKMESAIKGYGI